MPTTLAGRVLALRQKAGLKQRELDALAGICTSHTSMIECGLRDNITSETARGIADATGSSLDWLLSGKGEEPTAEHVRAAVEAARARRAAQADTDPAPESDVA